jgi:hypothetical protein
VSFVCLPSTGWLTLLTFGAQTNTTTSHRSLNVANMLEAAKEGIKKLYSRRLIFNAVCITIACVTAVAAITGTTTSPVVDYTTDVALGFCCAGALLAQDGAVAGKLVLFLLWEVYRAVRWSKVCRQSHDPQLTSLSRAAS